MNVVLEVRWIVDTRFLDCTMMVVPLMLVIRPAREGVSPGGGPGFVSGERIRRQWPQIAVLILTTYNEDELMIRGLQAGAPGYLLKDCSSETLLSAIRTAARGEMIVQSETLTRLLTYAARGVSPSKTGTTHEEFDLTEREREILTAVAQGKRGKEIAAQLHIADRTVRAHLTNIYAKLGLDSRTSAVAMALERGLLPRQHTGGNRDE